MEPSKAELDTLEMYMHKLGPEAKVQAVLARLAKKDGLKAQQIIQLFEGKKRMTLADVDRIVGR